MKISDTIPSAESSLTGWHGNLHLVYANHQGKTQLIQNQVKAPLKVQRPFYPEGPGVCHSVVLHTAGGMVGGDQLSLNFQLEPNAHALITTAAASKIYRSNGLEAKQTSLIQVAEGACLEWFPQETIVFNEAIYRQDLRIELAPKASCLGWEIIRLGRSARGEKFLRGNWRSYTEIWQQGRPLWVDRQWLPGGEEILNSPHGLDSQPVVASLVWVGQPISSEVSEKVRTLWTARVETEKTQHSKASAGVTRLLEGLLCRYRGNSTEEARSWFIEVWNLLRLSSLGKPACIPRVWQR